NSERSQEKRISSFEISYPTHTSTLKMRSMLTLRMIRLMNITSDREAGASMSDQTPGFLPLKNCLCTKPYVSTRSNPLHVLGR
ncbi:MAG TPA: hypothetical protein VEH56_06260, partial [Candidatus Saccharimonadales bacterium]|nr:hypothetical protein [Candidatus Saccharimonadales bacterium]